MLAKLNLDRTKEYEVAIACKEIATMLSATIEGRFCNKAIASEQGGIPKWDDFLLQDHNDVLTHIQVKRQNTQFSRFPPQRGVLNTGKQQDLSPLDGSLLELSNWSRALDFSNYSPKRKFRLEIADASVQIKVGIQVHQFATLCIELIKPTTTLPLFTNLLNSSELYQNIRTWLTSWCGFIDDEHIFKTLSLLSIHNSGSRNDIEISTKDELRRYFNDIETVYALLKDYVGNNATFTSAITPKPLMAHLERYLLGTFPSWTQYTQDGHLFHKSGIHDRRLESIEHPEKFVHVLWDGNSQSVLKLHADPDLRHNLPRAIVRLAVHIQQGSVAHFANHTNWKTETRHAVGGTLGIGENDTDTLPFFDCNGRKASTDFTTLRLSSELDDEAASISIEMTKKNWSIISQFLIEKIRALPASELKAAIENRWFSWKGLLDHDVSAQQDLTKAMLHPKAEGDSIIAELRVGPKTAPLIAQGIFMLLIVSVAFDGKDDDWKSLRDNLAVQVHSNQYWSGPSTQERKPRLMSAKGRESLLAGEPAKAIILAGVTASPNEIRTNNKTLMASGNDLTHLAVEKEPRLLVTACPRFTDLIDEGNIQSITNYLNENLISLQKAN